MGNLSRIRHKGWGWYSSLIRCYIRDICIKATLMELGESISWIEWKYMKEIFTKEWHTEEENMKNWLIITNLILLGNGTTLIRSKEWLLLSIINMLNRYKYLTLSQAMLLLIFIMKIFTKVLHIWFRKD